jgi:4-hydroxybenzoate polyprenyltransferase
MLLSRSTLLHVRLPFSWFLLPVFAIAAVTSPVLHPVHTVIVFVVFHFFLYTASNGFNSYYDRDNESIGGLEKPPPVTADLFWFSLVLDGAGLLLALLVGWKFALGCFIYGMASKLYSWDISRIKRHGIAGWLFVGIGQGTLAFLLISVGISGNGNWGWHDLVPFVKPAVFAGFFLLGVFPLTQVYQHREDARRGDLTISRILGIRQTFYFAGVFLIAAIGGFFVYFLRHCGPGTASLFALLLVPAVYYFIRWFLACRSDPARADFHGCMRMNLLASTGVNLFGLIVLAAAKLPVVLQQ